MATVYNLVGTRDQVLLAVVDETVLEVERLVDASLPGVDGCLSILAAGGEVILSTMERSAVPSPARSSCPIRWPIAGPSVRSER